MLCCGLSTGLRSYLASAGFGGNLLWKLRRYSSRSLWLSTAWITSFMLELRLLWPAILDWCFKGLITRPLLRSSFSLKEAVVGQSVRVLLKMREAKNGGCAYQISASAELCPSRIPGPDRSKP